MKTLASFAIRRRWVVIAGWLIFMFAAQAISSSLGGANYKDEFSLPGTETNTVASLLKHAGQNNQNGIDGIMVVHAKSGDLKTPPPELISPLEGQCAAGTSVVQIATPWGSIDCTAGGNWLSSSNGPPGGLSWNAPASAVKPWPSCARRRMPREDSG